MEFQKNEIVNIIRWLKKILNFLEKQKNIYLGLDIIIKTKVDYEILLNKILINYLIEYKNKQKVEDIDIKENELIAIVFKLTHDLFIIAYETYNKSLINEINKILNVIQTNKNIEYVNALKSLVKIAETNIKFSNQYDKRKKELKTLKKIIAYIDIFINESDNNLNDSYPNELRVYIYRIFVLLRDELDYFMFSFEYPDKNIIKELMKLRIDEAPIIKQIDIYPTIELPKY